MRSMSYVLDHFEGRAEDNRDASTLCRFLDRYGMQRLGFLVDDEYDALLSKNRVEFTQENVVHMLEKEVKLAYYYLTSLVERAPDIVVDQYWVVRTLDWVLGSDERDLNGLMLDQDLGLSYYQELAKRYNWELRSLDQETSVFSDFILEKVSDNDYCLYGAYQGEKLHDRPTISVEDMAETIDAFYTGV